MIDFNNIITVIGMLLSFWMGSRLSTGKSILPPSPGKLQVIELEETPEKYGEIWPKDRHYPDNEAVNGNQN